MRLSGRHGRCSNDADRSLQRHMQPDSVVKHEPDNERARDILSEIIALCARRSCVLIAGNGVFYLAKVTSMIPPEAVAIAQVRQVSELMAEWQDAESVPQAQVKV